MKKKLSFLIIAAMLAVMAPCVSAAESWRDAFVTRLMKIISSDPTYCEVVISDLDRNGIPEAFVLKNSADGGISTGFTMNGNSIENITVPKNIIGACLGDITVYNRNGEYIFIGQEIPRYASVIGTYRLTLDGNTLTANRVKRSDFEGNTVVPYRNMYGNDFLTNGYPNRAKIKDFIDSYTGMNELTAQKTNIKITVNGNEVEMYGYNVNYSNYFKIRDIAMVLRTTPAKFNVIWDTSLNAISITKGIKYEIVGGELSRDETEVSDIVQNNSPVYIDGWEHELVSYNINGSTYFKIRDIADIIGFGANWNDATNTLEITSY